MDENASYYITIIAVLVVLLSLSAFFAVCETGFSLVNKIKLKNMAEKTKGRIAARARLVLKLLSNYDRILSSILIGNTLVNISSSALATMLFIGLFGAKGVSYATIAMTVAILLFTEITPKTLAKESPERLSLRAAPLLHFFTLFFTPLNYLTGAWKKIIIRLFPVKTNRSVTEDELLTFVGEVRQEGGINRQEEQMIRQVIEFDDITAADIVTPRIDMAAVCENTAIEEIDRIFDSTNFSRLPVYHETIDTISGVILFKDFYCEVVKKGKPLPEIIKPVVFVTKTMKISKLLQILQKKQSHLAILVDEFGSTLGIITIEDIMEELVGEIWDEHDRIVEPIKQNADGSFTVLGSVKFLDMLEHINSGTAGKKSANDMNNVPAVTVCHWILETASAVPRIGDEFAWGELQIKVTKLLRHRVLEVIVSRKKH